MKRPARSQLWVFIEIRKKNHSHEVGQDLERKKLLQLSVPIRVSY